MAVAVAVLVVAAAIGYGGPASAESGRRAGTCQARVCLLVLDPAADLDGDGVTDADERALNADPKDPRDTPSAEQALDAVLTGDLPSFFQGDTDIAELPSFNVDTGMVETGLGDFYVGHNDSTLFPDLWRAIDGLEANGFDMSHGFTASVKLLPDELTIDEVTLLPGPEADMALVSAGGGVCCFGDYSANNGKTVTSVEGGEAHTDGTRGPEYTFSEDGGVERSYTANYTDGSHDEVYEGRKSDGSAFRLIDSYDEKGNAVQTSSESTSHWQDPDGTQWTHTAGTVTTYDSDGHKTGSTDRSVLTDTHPDGSSNTTTVTKTYDADGNLVKRTRDDQTTCAPGKECDGNENSKKYVDPDALPVAGITMPISPDEMARVMVELNVLRDPDPDHDDSWNDPVSPEDLMARAQLNGFCPDGCTIYDNIDPDGVALLGVMHPPDFSNTVLPDKGNDLFTGLGQDVPIPVGDGGSSDHTGGGVPGGVTLYTGGTVLDFVDDNGSAGAGDHRDPADGTGDSGAGEGDSDGAGGNDPYHWPP